MSEQGRWHDPENADVWTAGRLREAVDQIGWSALAEELNAALAAQREEKRELLDALHTANDRLALAKEAECR